MRIDGRFDPKVWVQPRAGEAVPSNKPEDRPQEREMVLSVSEQRDADMDFATASENAYAYTHANQIAARVTGMLEVTPDL